MTSLNKITIHWTAGSYTPNITDLNHYHYLVDNTGRIWDGFHKPEDNLNTKDGNYAAHTGGGNTGNIGIAMCAMAGFKNSSNVGDFPITAPQFEACMQKVAVLCKKYGITPTHQNVFTHYEFGLKNPNTSSKGKIDIIFIPSYPNLKASACGNFIRKKVIWYMQHI